MSVDKILLFYLLKLNNFDKVMKIFNEYLFCLILIKNKMWKLFLIKKKNNNVEFILNIFLFKFYKKQIKIFESQINSTIKAIWSLIKELTGNKNLLKKILKDMIE